MYVYIYINIYIYIYTRIFGRASRGLDSRNGATNHINNLIIRGFRRHVANWRPENTKKTTCLDKKPPGLAWGTLRTPMRNLESSAALRAASILAGLGFGSRHTHRIIIRSGTGHQMQPIQAEDQTKPIQAQDMAQKQDQLQEQARDET